VKLKINESAVLKHINVLKKKGVLTRIGGTRGHWQVLGLDKEDEK
jgi:predicted HTH transcriptional regulator